MNALLADRKVHEWLERVDGDLAQTVRAEGCTHCGEVLHSAMYPRKPRGGPAEVLDRWDKRASFCCEKDGCRKRHTPPSVRFLGRKVYLGVVVVLVAAMMHGANGRRVAHLHDALGIDMRTLKRWRQWWLEHFVRTAFWKARRSRFMPVLDEAVMPFCLAEAFGADTRTGLFNLMAFLSALTTDSCQEVVAM